MLFVLECLIFVFALDHSDSVQSTKCVKISFIVADCIIMTRLVVTNYIQEYLQENCSPPCENLQVCLTVSLCVPIVIKSG